MIQRSGIVIFQYGQCQRHLFGEALNGKSLAIDLVNCPNNFVSVVFDPSADVLLSYTETVGQNGGLSSQNKHLAGIQRVANCIDERVGG